MGFLVDLVEGMWLAGFEFELCVVSFELRVNVRFADRLNWPLRIQGETMQDLRNIDAWVKAHTLVLAVYRETQAMPREEVFGVTVQMRRSAIAIATRIAEGAGRGSSIEFTADLRRAQASCNELEYLLLLARDLGYWKQETWMALTTDTVGYGRCCMDS